MSRSFEYDELFWLRSFVEPRANVRQAWTVFAGIVACDDLQQRRFDFFCRTIPVPREQNQSVDFTGLGCDRGVRGCGAAKTASHYCHRLCTVLSEIADCGEHVEIHRSRERVFITRAM